MLGVAIALSSLGFQRGRTRAQNVANTRPSVVTESAPILISPVEHHRPTPSRAALFAIAGVAVVALFWALSGHASSVAIAVFGVGSLATLAYSVPYTRRNPEWLILPLILIFLLIASSIMDERIRGILHYAAIALYCVPVFSEAWRSKLMRSGGFRLYMIYWGWCAVTIVYSLAPMFSLARLIEANLVYAALVATALWVESEDDVTRVLLHFLQGCGVVVALTAIALVAMPHSATWATPAESYTPEMLQQMQQMGINIYGIDRFRGIFDNPNDVGALMLIISGAAMVCWRNSTRRQKLFLFSLVGASALFAALADSRSGIAGFFIGGGAYMLWRWKWRGVFWMLVIGALLTGAMMIWNRDLIDYVERGDVSTLTGRTDMWVYVVHRIMDAPILGYGYQVSGAVFDPRTFPLWWGPWDQGPHSSIHNGYLGHAVGVGLPATIFWAFIMLRPWWFVMRQEGDPWRLKSVFLLIVVPVLIENMTEDLTGDFIGAVTLLFGVVWAMAERYRLLALEEAEAVEHEALSEMPRAVGALATLRG